ncbi:hypothetical protein SEA_ANNADREAMY_256 [Streptomyces phage Annadreamy]|uniref:Uncharacterized protein n=2 Tax=Annadreamyvirus annadreamy TaxID=2846392 RepID=A0A345GTR3_9CAUD|nr:hypothetical protein HWB75_gp023 [Streptomyces phage Annadreamy]AXG66335.1 hypothetical protein SEA_ANNADREAMY_256 [Streptomyces phage Annadreamy]QGH79563.1 hypothetical protein SEA_LIMPID_262 [Streptomyces phage Limpid]
MNITTVSVNGRSGIAAGVGKGPNAGKRFILWDDENGSDVGSWVPAESVMVTTPLDRV